MKRVHLTPGDGAGWAIDEDLRLLRGSLVGEGEFTSLARADIVHAVWWQRLLRFSPRDFTGRHVLCYADNAPFHYASGPEFLKARALVTLWIARSREAVAQFSTLGIESQFAPYTFDPAIFRPLPPDDAEVHALREKWRIPANRYLLANFHRDTEGRDRNLPKLQKGPDAFLEIATQLYREGLPVQVLLAGPRRFYLRTQLARRGVPFTFVGEDTGERDDYAVNILPRTTLNALYQIADLHLITSRWEGGPHSVLEAAGARCNVISTPVGIAPDVLAPECLFESLPEACEIIRRDLREKHLQAFAGRHFQTAHEHHTAPALRRHLVEIYRRLEPRSGAHRGVASTVAAGLRDFAQRVRSCFPTRPHPLDVAIVHQPGGAGGASFDALFAELVGALERGGGTVTRELTPQTNAVLLGEVAPSDPRLKELRTRPELPVIAWPSETKVGALPAGTEPRHDVVILPSIDALDALRRSGLLPPRVLVLPPPPANDSSSPDPLVIATGDASAAGRIARALAEGRPVLYPANSHYRWLVWFAGLSYGSAEELPVRHETLRAHPALWPATVPPSDLPSVADRLMRLFHIIRELRRV